jgi:hypothetical protein
VDVHFRARRYDGSDHIRRATLQHERQPKLPVSHEITVIGIVPQHPRPKCPRMLRTQILVRIRRHCLPPIRAEPRPRRDTVAREVRECEK